MLSRMRRIVALKVIGAKSAASLSATRRFHREVEAAAKLIHPNIVTAFDADEAASVAVFTGTGGYFCAGADLKAVAAGDPNKKREIGGHDSIAPMGPSRLRLSKPVIAAVEGTGVTVSRLLLIGGAARNEAVRTVAAQVFGRDVLIPEPGEYVASGAARQAAWVLTGTLPSWDTATTTVPADPHPEVLEQYRAATR